MNPYEDDPVAGWTIYHRPLDYPNHYAVRMWLIVDDSGVVHHQPVAGLYDTLAEARNDIPAGCICVGREEADDPVIVETWM